MDITRKERAAFAIAGAGQNMVNTMVGTFLLTYMYSSAVGLSAKGVAALGVFMTVSKIWDAVNDPIMGVVVDKTHTKFGKLRPYILITALPMDLPRLSRRRLMVAPPPRACFMTKLKPPRLGKS